MRTNIIFLAIIVFISAGYTIFTLHHDRPIFANTYQQKKISTAINENVPEFEYRALSGKKGKLSDHKGKVVLIHFWATWCTPCLVEFPLIIELSKKLEKDIVVLAISSDQQTAPIKRFIKKIDTKIPSNFIIIEDSEKHITYDMFQTMRLPETYILSPNLSINEKVIGARKAWESNETIDQLRSLLHTNN